MEEMLLPLIGMDKINLIEKSVNTPPFSPYNSLCTGNTVESYYLNILKFEGHCLFYKAATLSSMLLNRATIQYLMI